MAHLTNSIMGFFSNLFKKKKGGTFVGNLIRGVASGITGGALGSGKKLAEWEAEQEQMEYEQALAIRQQQLQQNQAFLQGQSLVDDYGNGVTDFVQDSTIAQRFQNKQVNGWLSRNWWVIALPATVILVLIIILATRRK